MLSAKSRAGRCALLCVAVAGAMSMAPAVRGLEVAWTKTSYSVAHGKSAVFRGAPIAFFVDGEWAVESRKTLTLKSQRTFHGLDVSPPLWPSSRMIELCVILDTLACLRVAQQSHRRTVAPSNQTRPGSTINNPVRFCQFVGQATIDSFICMRTSPHERVRVGLL